MSASRDAKAEVFADVSSIQGRVECAGCRGDAVQKVVDVCSPTHQIGPTGLGFVASFPGAHLKSAFAAPRLPEAPSAIDVRRWFVAAAWSMPFMAGVLAWNRAAGAASCALPIAFLTIGWIEYRRDRDASFTYRSAVAWHAQESGFWARLYFCHSCGQVFLPNDPRSVPPDQWRRLMV
jgi:hypothetical protein